VGGYPLLGSHFFINATSGSGISPVWDFRGASAKGNPDAFTLAAEGASIPAPTGPQDVDWVQLKSVSGALATEVCDRAHALQGCIVLMCPAIRFTVLIQEEEFHPLRCVLSSTLNVGKITDGHPVRNWVSAYNREVHLQIL